MPIKSRRPVNATDVFEVEKILNKKIVYNNSFYLIKWKGYSISDSTWVPLQNLNCPVILSEFEKTFDEKDKKANKKKGNKKGNLKDDEPKEIIHAEVVEKKGEKIINCIIEWKARSDGTVPLASTISNEELRKKNLTSLLFNFYESRLRFPKDE